MEQAERGDIQIITSAFTLAEVFKRKCDTVANTLPPASDTIFEQYFLKDFVILVAVDREVATYARRLLRRFKEIKQPQDAVHLATAALNDVDELHTYDGNNLLPLDGKVMRADNQPLRICTPIAPPPGTSGPLFEKTTADDEGSSAAGVAAP